MGTTTTEKTRAQELLQMQARSMIIDGLSPAFLQVLVNEARKLSRIGKLVEDNGDDLCLPTGLGAVVLYHIADQIKGGWQHMNWDVQIPVRVSTAAKMISTAEGFLEVIASKQGS